MDVPVKDLESLSVHPMLRRLEPTKESPKAQRCCIYRPSQMRFLGHVAVAVGFSFLIAAGSSTYWEDHGAHTEHGQTFVGGVIRGRHGNEGYGHTVLW